ncbi:MAG TPA: hypothetical protein VF819_10585 [Nitrospira sp.]
MRAPRAHPLGKGFVEPSTRESQSRELNIYKDKTDWNGDEQFTTRSGERVHHRK